MDTSKQKYLKYKNKYIDLKKKLMKRTTITTKGTDPYLTELEHKKQIANYLSKQPLVSFKKITKSAVFLLSGDDILFLRQRNSSWITPGTYIKIGESPFQAVAREFRENTGGQNIPFCFNGPKIFYKDLLNHSLRIYVCKSNVNKDQILQNFKTNLKIDNLIWLNKHMVRKTKNLNIQNKVKLIFNYMYDNKYL